MAETVAELLVKIGADVEGLKTGSAEMRGVLARLQADSDKAAGGFSRFQAATVSVAAAVNIATQAYRLFAGVASSVASTVSAFVDAASDQSDAQLQLANALELTGNASEKVISAFDEQASAMQKVSRFADESVTAVQGLLTRFGVLPQDMQAATQAVADFAAATGQDLTTAAETLGRAIEGQTRGFKQYGITLEDTGSKSQNLANAVGALNDKFAGSALASVQNMRGNFIVLASAFDEVKETLGGFLTDSDEGKRVLKFFTDELVRLNEELTHNKAGIAAFVDEGLRALVTGFITTAKALVLAADVFEIAGRKLAAFAKLTANITNPTGFAAVKQAFGDLTGAVETHSEALLIRLSQVEERFQNFGTEAPKIAKTGDAIGGVGTAAEKTSTSMDKLTASSTKLGAVADPTAAALEKQEAALASMDETLANLDFEAATAGLTPLEAEIAKTADDFQKLGEAAGVSLDTITAKTEEAAQKTREAFNKDLFGDYAAALATIRVESEAWALSAGRNATEQQKLAQAVEDQKANLDAAVATYVRAKTNTGAFSQETLVAQNNVRLAQRAYEDAGGALASYEAELEAAADNSAALAEETARVARNLGNLARGSTGRTFELGVDERPFEDQLAQLQQSGATADEFRRLAEEAKAAAESIVVDTRSMTTLGDAGGFARFLATNKFGLEQVAAAADLAADAVERFGEAAGRVSAQGIITIPILATGSPTLPFSQYFDQYLPQKLAHLDLEPEPLIFRTSVDGVDGGGIAPIRASLRTGANDSPLTAADADMMREQNDILRDIADSNRHAADASARTASEVGGDSFASRLLGRMETTMKRRGERNFAFSTRRHV